MAALESFMYGNPVDCIDRIRNREKKRIRKQKEKAEREKKELQRQLERMKNEP